MKIENIHHLRVATKKKKITENFMKFLIEHSVIIHDDNDSYELLLSLN